MKREDSLDAYASRHLSHRKGLVDPRSSSLNDDTLKDLKSLLGSFNDPQVNPYGVSRLEIVDSSLIPKLGTSNCFQNVHFCPPFRRGDVSIVYCYL